MGKRGGGKRRQQQQAVPVDLDEFIKKNPAKAAQNKNTEDQAWNKLNLGNSDQMMVVEPQKQKQTIEFNKQSKEPKETK